MLRHPTIAVQVGHITIGGGAPVVVQSMTDTDTANVAATVAQVKALADAGSELVRITVNVEAAAQGVAEIRQRLDALGCCVPLVGDFHYNGHRLLTQFPDCAKALAKYRINPGNVGFGKKHDEQFSQIIKIAIDHDKPVRIGVNWGSLNKALVTQMMNDNAKLDNPLTTQEVLREALVASTLNSAKFAEKLGLPASKIVVSAKVSTVQDLITVYQMLAERSQYALHLGLTEAGMGSKGIVASSTAMGILLQQGIGDTIRTSLTPEVGGARTQEVIVSQQILQTMGIRSFAPLVTSCPGCGRTTSSFFRELAAKIETHIRQNISNWRAEYVGVESMTIAVMGCVVNGPGESKHANIGISLPGTGEAPTAPVFIDGKKTMTLRGDDIAEQFIRAIESYIVSHYAARETAAV